MLPLEALSDMRVWFATPAYGSQTSTGYAATLFRLGSHLGKRGMDCWLELGSESLITRARNRLVAQFLSEPKWTHLFFIDADVGATVEAVFRTLLADRDVVAGVYPLKRYMPPAEIPAGMSWAQFEDKYTPYPFNAIDGVLKSDLEGFGEVAEATTGFMCIKRAVLERMSKAYPELWYDPDDHPSKEIRDNSFLFFDTMHDPLTKRYLSEDYAFCHRWREIGGQVWIDVHSKLNHFGQHAWRGDLYANLNVAGVRRSGGI